MSAPPLHFGRGLETYLTRLEFGGDCCKADNVAEENRYLILMFRFDFATITKGLRNVSRKDVEKRKLWLDFVSQGRRRFSVDSLQSQIDLFKGGANLRVFL